MFFVSSGTSVISISIRYKWILKKFFQKCSRSPILTPGVSNRSSFKSRLTKSKSQVSKTVYFPRNSKSNQNFPIFFKFFALISSFSLQFDDRYVSKCIFSLKFANFSNSLQILWFLVISKSYKSYKLRHF